MDYQTFLQSKRVIAESSGMEIEQSAIHPSLFPFQKALVQWALRKGRCALFAECGMGKSFMQLEFARLTGKRALIIAPLSVARQTVSEAQKIDVVVHYTRSGSDLIDTINITNYEMIDHFNPDDFGTVVLDESSILKCFSGITCDKLIDKFIHVPYRLCCSATPAPNDHTEIGQHAEFLGIMKRTEMLSSFFVHDSDHGSGSGWRLKGHAQDAFYRWMASWSMSVKKPSDLGFDDTGYVLPELSIHQVIVSTDYVPEGQLFSTGLKGITDRSKARKGTINERVEEVVKLVNSNDEQWILWCGRNDESSSLAREIVDSVEIVGSDSPDAKISAIEAFQSGKVRILITKPKIAGFGINLQNCHNMAFVGMNDSFEEHYQCIRRCYRFGQLYPVHAYIVISEIEQEIYANVMRKEQEAQQMSTQLIQNVQTFERAEIAFGQQRGEYASCEAMILPDFLLK
jgi:Helicase conserved C-terminal domain